MRELTRRQDEILHLLCEECLSNERIAARLHLSPKTIEVHRADIYRKLGVTKISELCKYYWQGKFSSFAKGSRV